MLPKISVIIVVRNAVSMLDKAINSVLSQHYPHLEFIIIDGGSTDGTVEIIKKYASRLAYWHSQPDGGAGVALNIALEKMTGAIVAFLFADDWYEPNTLKIIGETFAKYSNVDMVSCGSKVVVADSASDKYKVRRVFQDKKQLDLNLKNILFGTPLIGARFIRKTFLDRVGNFHALDAQRKYNYSNDTEWLLRAVLNNVKNIIVDHVGYVYLAHNKSDTFSRNMQTVKRIRCEHVLMAETFLSPDLTVSQRKTLQAWHRDQLVRLILCTLYLRDWNAVRQVLKKSLHIYPLQMLDAFANVSLAIIFNRMRGLVK